MLLEGKVEIHLLFLYPFLRRWCQKVYKNTGTFRKGMSIHFGTVYQSFLVVLKVHISGLRKEQIIMKRYIYHFYNQRNDEAVASGK